MPRGEPAALDGALAAPAGGSLSVGLNAPPSQRWLPACAGNLNPFLAAWRWLLVRNDAANAHAA